MKVITVTQKNKKSVERFVSREWSLFNKEKKYVYKEKKYSLVVMDNGKPVGYAFFKINGGAGHLSQLISSKNYRSKGVGYLLLSSFENVLKKRKCHVAYLETSQKHTEALKFYKRNGYKIIATLRKNKCGFDWYYLEKRL